MMTVLMLKTAKIRSFETGLYFRDGEFKGLLHEGRHWLFDPLGRVHVEVVSQRDPWLVHDKLDVIVKSGALNLIFSFCHWWGRLRRRLPRLR